MKQNKSMSEKEELLMTNGVISIEGQNYGFVMLGPLPENQDDTILQNWSECAMKAVAEEMESLGLNSNEKRNFN